jgi:hypothetical protein
MSTQVKESKETIKEIKSGYAYGSWEKQDCMQLQGTI